MKKKLLTSAILVLSAVLLVAASVLGTFAFLASSTAVSNTFTVGDVAIDMRESAVDANGQDNDNEVGSTENLRTSDGNSYELIPGKTYCKDPAIYVNAGSTPSYLFVKVKNGISTLEKKDDLANPTMKEQMVAKGWQLVKTNDLTKEELYIYVGMNGGTTKAIATIPDDPDDIQDKITAVGSKTQDEVYEVFDKFTIAIAEKNAIKDYASATVTLTAFAIQTEGFTATKDGYAGYQRAWNSIVERFPHESGTYFEKSNLVDPSQTENTGSGEGTENQ